MRISVSLITEQPNIVRDGADDDSDNVDADDDDDDSDNRGT